MYIKVSQQEISNVQDTMSCNERLIRNFLSNGRRMTVLSVCRNNVVGQTVWDTCTV